MIHILAPVILLVGLGFFLARLRFLGRGFMDDLNKLVFWITLPALLFRSVVHADRPGPATFSLVALLVCATLAAALGGWVFARLIQLPRSSWGTFSQSCFRGNLAYIGIPVLAYAFEGSDPSNFSTAVIVMAFLMAVFNILAVLVLQSGHSSGGSWRLMLRSIFTNPLLLAGLSGIPFAYLHITLPLFLDRTLEALGGAAVPIALLCIGGSLAHARRFERIGAIFGAALIKTFCVPLFVWLVAGAFGISGADLRIALVLAACPTAAASYIMAKQMNGDEVLAGGSIVMSTLLSGLSIPLVLLIAR